MSMTTIKNNTSLEVMDKSVFANLEAIRSLVKTQENAPDAADNQHDIARTFHGFSQAFQHGFPVHFLIDKKTDKNGIKACNTGGLRGGTDAGVDPAQNEDWS